MFITVMIYMVVTVILAVALYIATNYNLCAVIIVIATGLVLYRQTKILHKLDGIEKKLDGTEPDETDDNLN